MVGDLVRDRCASSGIEENRVRVVLTIAPINMRGNVQEGVLDGLSGMKVARVVDVASGVSGVSGQDEP